MVVGGIIALLVFGLPLATIGLYIASILDHKDIRSRKTVEVPPEAETSASEVTRRRNNQLLIAYGRDLGGLPDHPIRQPKKNLSW